MTEHRDLADALEAKDAEIARLREALSDCVNPLNKIRRDADGQPLSYMMAYSIANDLSFVQGIARQALKAERN